VGKRVLSIEQTLDALARNAERLLRDAEILLKHGSHQTAVSLSILAIEEAGKHRLIEMYPKTPERAYSQFRGRMAHRVKQHILGVLYDNLDWIRDIIATHRTTSNSPISAESFVEAIVEKVLNAEPSQLEKDAIDGTIDRLKQSGLYVDVDKARELVSTPYQITRETAEEWIGHARFAIDKIMQKSTR
jgi:AbiV family abortive infection protein